MGPPLPLTQFLDQQARDLAESDALTDTSREGFVRSLKAPADLFIEDIAATRCRNVFEPTWCGRVADS